MAQTEVTPGSAKPGRLAIATVRGQTEANPRAARQEEGKRPQPSSKRQRRAPVGTEKEIALFGRKMIVPIRFVRGGLPGPGRGP